MSDEKRVFEGIVDAIEADPFGGEVSIYLEYCNLDLEKCNHQIISGLDGRRVRVTVEPLVRMDSGWISKDDLDASKKAVIAASFIRNERVLDELAKK